MAIIKIPDDEAIENCVTNRSNMRDVGGPDGWVNEPVVAEIVGLTPKDRKLNFLNGCNSLKDLKELTIIGHGSSHGFLIGPEGSKNIGTLPINSAEMTILLQKNGYARKEGYSIDVMGCFSAYFAKGLSSNLPGVTTKGYTDPISIPGGLPMYPVGGPRVGKAKMHPHKNGEGYEDLVHGKKIFLNGFPVQGCAPSPD